MRTSYVPFPRPRARVPSFAAAGLSIVLSAWGIGACTRGADVEDSTGIAVTVELDAGVTVPGVFRGSRAEASEQSEGSFHFAERHPRVSALGPGTGWFVDGQVEDVARTGIPVILRREDGTVALGEFWGPRPLAEQLSEAWATRRGVTAPSPSIVLELPERHPQVRVIPPGTTVRVIPIS